MLTFKTAAKDLFAQSGDCKVLFVTESTDLKKELKEVIKAFPGTTAIIKDREFTGKALSSITIPVSDGSNLFYLVLVGLGKQEGKKAIELETYRRALGVAMRVVEELKVDEIALQLPASSLVGVTDEALAEQTVSLLEIAQYVYEKYITDKARQKDKKYSFAIVLDGHNKKDVEAGIERGKLIGEAVNQARHWIDLPPSHLTPVELADKAQEIAKKGKLKYTVFSEKEVNQMGMGGLAGVSRGSDVDCKLVILEYKSANKNAPTVAFVGKGITFDSGGLSLKPAQYMETMKEDMSGAAAVIASMGVIAQLKPDINVVGITPLAENLPSGKATKPGDILTFYNGKTAEVLNTDAEGRLILADALSYAVKHYKPDAIIDIATLTGACAYALGPFFTGLFSEDDKLVAQMQEAGKRSGDRLWRLPLHDDYKKAIVSKVADICNIGSKKINAGATTAAHFLQHFVGDVPWAHLDIAGTAFDVPDIPYFRSGLATGVGVRLFVDLAMNWPTKKK